MYRILSIAIMIITLSCKKEKDEIKTTTVAELLTQKPWVLTSYGFDVNRNAQIDPAEESIEDCQKDNTWHYYADGTGLFDDNILSCATGIEKQPFTWKLVQGDTTLDFFYASPKILKIHSNEMVLYKELNDVEGKSLKLIFVFRH